MANKVKRRTVKRRTRSKKKTKTLARVRTKKALPGNPSVRSVRGHARKNELTAAFRKRRAPARVTRQRVVKRTRSTSKRPVKVAKKVKRPTKTKFKSPVVVKDDQVFAKVTKPKTKKGNAKKKLSAVIDYTVKNRSKIYNIIKPALRTIGIPTDAIDYGLSFMNHLPDMHYDEIVKHLVHTNYKKVTLDNSKKQKVELLEAADKATDDHMKIMNDFKSDANDMVTDDSRVYNA